MVRASGAGIAFERVALRERARRRAKPQVGKRHVLPRLVCVAAGHEDLPVRATRSDIEQDLACHLEREEWPPRRRR